jgi:hypothetical protein
VAEQLDRALRSSITDVNVKWKTSQAVLHSVPEHTPPVFVGDRLLFYALLDESMPFDYGTTVELVSKQYQQPLGVVCIDHTLPALSPQTVTRLAAKALFRELLHGSKTPSKELLVNLSIKYGILCPHTAFIGVERRLDASSDNNADMELREVAIMPSPAYQRPALQSQVRLASLRSNCTQNNSNHAAYIIQNNVDKVFERSMMLSMLDTQADMLPVRSSQFYCKASKLKQKRSISVGSILQPVVGFVSSFFTRKNVDDQISTVSTASYQSQQDLDVNWPIDEQQLVERFIERQQYDGLWMLTENDIKQLTSKTLADFSSSLLNVAEKGNQQLVTTTALVIVILETRCASSKVLWQALSNKAQKRLLELLGGDQAKLDKLMKDIRDQLV